MVPDSVWLVPSALNVWVTMQSRVFRWSCNLKSKVCMCIHAVLDQSFAADGGVCRNDIMLQKLPDSPEHTSYYTQAYTLLAHKINIIIDQYKMQGR